MMNLITWLLRIAIFIVLLLFASMNSGSVVLNYYLEQSIELPLSLVLFLFFAFGAIIAMIFERCRCH